MRVLDQVLDELNERAKILERVTRRKRQWTRKDLEDAIALGTAAVSLVATVVPQVRPAAAVLMGLYQGVKTFTKRESELHVKKNRK